MKPATSSCIACYLILVIVSISFFSMIWDPDFFWHLATGKWIVENFALPGSDPFGVYTDASSERALLILKGYWLCQSLYYLLFSNFGFISFAFLKSATFVILFLGQLSLLRKKGCGIAIVTAQAFIVYLELLAFRADRPQMFSYLGVLLVLLLIELKQYRWLPLVMLAWANIHGAYLVGVIIIAIHALIAAVRRFRKQGEEPSSAIFWYIAAIASAGINPNYFGAFKEVISMQSGEYQKTVFEYISPITLAYKFHDIYWGYFLVLSLGIVLLIALHKRIPFEQITVFACLSTLSLTASRYMPFLVICGSIYIALWLSPVCVKWGRSIVIASGVLTLMGIICISDVREGRGFSHGIEKGRYPERALEFIKSAGIKGNLFCNDYWGGYILLNSPDRHISIDGRGLSTEQYLKNVAILYNNNAFDEFTSSDYQVALTSALNLITGDNYLLWQRLANSPDWKLVYADEIALVFVKNDSAVKGLINPSKTILEQALKQAVFFADKFPDTPFHLTNLADIYLQRNELALAGKTLRKALEKNPNDPELNNRIILIDRALSYTRQ